MIHNREYADHVYEQMIVEVTDVRINHKYGTKEYHILYDDSSKHWVSSFYLGKIIPLIKQYEVRKNKKNHYPTPPYLLTDNLLLDVNISYRSSTVEYT